MKNTATKRVLAALLLLAAGALAVAQMTKNKMLLFAAMVGSVDDVKIELRNGANVNARSDDGMTPLMYAAGFNEDPSVAKILITAGASISAKSNDGMTAIMYAAGNNSNPDVIKILTAAGADVNATAAAGVAMTALMYAVSSNTNPDVVKALINSGARVNTKDKLGDRAIDYLEMRKEQDAEFAKTDAYRKMKELLQ